MMKYLDKIFSMTSKLFILIWNVLSLFFGVPYEAQAKKMKDYDARGKNNPKRENTVYRANKVSKD